MTRTFRVATRGSKLALAQSGQVVRALKRLSPASRFELVVVKTKGDEFQTVELFRENGGIGVFTKAIEDALLEKRADLAVHSLKDLPTALPKKLSIGAVPKRAAAEDVLITKKRLTVEALPIGARVGTGSPRRKRQLLRARPDLDVRDLRGNLDTRVGKALSGELDAVVVARAGLLRLGKYLKFARTIPVATMLPAVGQAALAIEARRDDRETLALLKKLDHAPSRREAEAERALLAGLRGGCRVPVGAKATAKGRMLTLRASVFSVGGSGSVDGRVKGPAAKAEALGRRLARELLKNGAKRFLKEARP